MTGLRPNSCALAANLGILINCPAGIWPGHYSICCSAPWKHCSLDFYSCHWPRFQKRLKILGVSILGGLPWFSESAKYPLSENQVLWRCLILGAPKSLLFENLSSPLKKYKLKNPHKEYGLEAFNISPETWHLHRQHSISTGSTASPTAILGN